LAGDFCRIGQQYLLGGCGSGRGDDHGASTGQRGYRNPAFCSVAALSRLPSRSFSKCTTTQLASALDFLARFSHCPQKPHSRVHEGEGSGGMRGLGSFGFTTAKLVSPPIAEVELRKPSVTMSRILDLGAYRWAHRRCHCRTWCSGTTAVPKNLTAGDTSGRNNNRRGE